MSKLTTYPTAKANRQARRARKEAKLASRAIQRSLEKRPGMDAYVNASHPEHARALALAANMPDDSSESYEAFERAFAKGGDIPSVLFPEGTIEVISQALFTPPNCYHVGGQEPCVQECMIIYGSVFEERIHGPLSPHQD